MQLTPLFLFLFPGIMTLSRGPYSELDKMSLFQDLKLKRRKVDSRCSSDGESIADTSTSSPDLLQPLSPKMCDQQQSAGQLELEDHAELEDGSPAPAAAANHHHHHLQHPSSHHHHQQQHQHHHHLHHHHHSNNVENNNTLTSNNNNNNDCLTSPKLVHDGSVLRGDDGDSERASPDSPGLLIDERPPSRLKPSDPGGCTPGTLPNSSNCGGGASVIRSVADERPRSSSPPNSHNLALMNSIQLLQQHYSANSSTSSSSIGGVHSGPSHHHQQQHQHHHQPQQQQQQQHVTVLVTPSRMKPDHPTTLVTLGMRKQAPPSINLENTNNSSSNNTNSSSTNSSNNCNGSNKNEEPNRLTSTPQSSTSSSPSSSSSYSTSSSNSSSISSASPNQANQHPVQLQMFQQPPSGGMPKFSSSQSSSNIHQQQQHLAQQQMLQAMQHQIRIKKERMPQYTIVNQNANMPLLQGGQLRQPNIHMIPNPQQQLYVKRERPLPGQSHTIVNMPPVSMAGPANHQRQPPTSPVQVCNSSSPMQPPMSPSQQHQNRQQSPVHVGSTNMGQSPHIIIKRERQQPSQNMANQAMQLSPNNQRLPSPIQVSPTTSPLNPAMQIRHPMRDAAILFRVKNEAQVPNIMQQQPPGMGHRITVWPGGQQRINGVKPEVIGGPLPPIRSQMSPQQSPQHHQSPSPIASQTPPRNTPTVIMGESCGVRTMVWSYDSPPQVQTTTPSIPQSSSASAAAVASQGQLGPGSSLGMGAIPPSPGNHHHQNSNSSSSSSSTNNNEEAAHLLLSLGQTVRQNEVNFFDGQGTLTGYR